MSAALTERPPPGKNETSRWNVGKDLSFVPLRPDREPASCTYDQLDRPVRFNLADVLISGEGPA